MSNKYREPWESSNFFYGRTDPWPGTPLHTKVNRSAMWEAIREMAKGLLWFAVLCILMALTQISLTELPALFRG